MKRIVFALLVICFVIACKNQPHDQPYQSDREPNGGLLRMTIEGRPMHDRFFVAQFTPKGELFETDNLQLFNYNIDSEKYPKLLISIDHLENELKNWQKQAFPLDVFALILEENTVPLQAKGELWIDKIDERFIHGSFSGDLIHPENGTQFPLRGEFKAVLRYNR
ncbi:MAG TPA: hypothetical protein PKN04_02635 [bacterium]|nr:hypothetical protein [bacterium]HNT64650.1 hypothetical protein [bacterium]HOX85811.1 hypothetical protein [bacterium]HPG45206.1 hypothetical protein [bacterium]HPM97448.1 hypothetical protein [bacterium]